MRIWRGSRTTVLSVAAGTVGADGSISYGAPVSIIATADSLSARPSQTLDEVSPYTTDYRNPVPEDFGSDVTISEIVMDLSPTNGGYSKLAMMYNDGAGALYLRVVETFAAGASSTTRTWSLIIESAEWTRVRGKNVFTLNCKTHSTGAANPLIT